VDFAFNTTTAAQAPITLGGTPAVKVYKANASATEVTTGVTLTVDHDSTGAHHLRVVLTDSFYEPLNDYFARITTGTVDGISVVGAVLCQWSIENRFKGEAVQATAQGGAASSITLASAESSTDDTYNGDFILTVDGTGEGQMRQITDYVGASRAATVDRAWATNPDSTTVYRRFPNSLGSTLAEQTDAIRAEFVSDPIEANVIEINDVAIIGDGDGTPFNVA
jgi:hypothetical protein